MDQVISQYPKAMCILMLISTQVYSMTMELKVTSGRTECQLNAFVGSRTI